MSSKNNKLRTEDNSNNNAAKIFFGVCALLLVGLVVFMFSFMGSGKQDTSEGTATISEDGKQVINLTAKGGYSPGIITAQADKESVLKVKTTNTFDCSSALTIPSLNVNKNLPANGETLINLPIQAAGTELKGTCSMGMYNFTIKFV